MSREIELLKSNQRFLTTMFRFKPLNNFSINLLNNAVCDMVMFLKKENYLSNMCGV